MPAFTTVPTKVTGNSVSLTNWNTHLAQNLNLLGNPPRAIATSNATQSINNATLTAVALATEVNDSASLHDLVTNNSRMTIPSGEGGDYLITAYVEFVNNATGQRVLAIYKNGAVLVQQNQDATAGGNATRMIISFRYTLAAADYIEMYVSQNSGGAINISSGNILSIQRVA